MHTRESVSLDPSSLNASDLRLKQNGPSSSSSSDFEIVQAFKNNQYPAGMNLRLTVPKRNYSTARQDSLLVMETPVFDKHIKPNMGPNSPGTVLTVAGLFAVGLMLILSGIIVLCQQSETPFVVTGSLFVCIGALMILVSAILQRKNIVKFVLELNRDLYFLNMSDSYMWKLMFVQKTQLPEPSPQHAVATDS
ncbi:unnamed protein product [Anisakis simplex]|uniref:Transmembrane protein 243 n=1 Tax=Anisakis simplex TaxID=6269 RepID=A0A0M3JXQ2_ANISI|nr:unnamed protein product [Anisakis simplex]